MRYSIFHFQNTPTHLRTSSESIIQLCLRVLCQFRRILRIEHDDFQTQSYYQMYAVSTYCFSTYAIINSTPNAMENNIVFIFTIRIFLFVESVMSFDRLVSRFYVRCLYTSCVAQSSCQEGSMRSCPACCFPLPRGNDSFGRSISLPEKMSYKIFFVCSVDGVFGLFSLLIYVVLIRYSKICNNLIQIRNN